MKIALSEWAKRNYSPPPSLYILRAWANSGQIVPAPEKVGCKWMVEENAKRIPMPVTDWKNLDGLRSLSTKDQEFVREILNAK